MIDGNGKISRMCVSRADSFKMAHWVDAHWESIKAMTRDETCTKLTELVGKPVTKNTLKGLLDDLGKEWPGRTPRVAAKPGVGREKQRILATNLIRAAKTLDWLAQQLGVTIPADLRVDLPSLVKIRSGVSMADAEVDAK